MPQVQLIITATTRAFMWRLVLCAAIACCQRPSCDAGSQPLEGSCSLQHTAYSRPIHLLRPVRAHNVFCKYGHNIVHNSDCVMWRASGAKQPLPPCK